MRARKAEQKGWYRRNWKAVARIWGLFLGLLLLVALGYLAIGHFLHPRARLHKEPHVHVPTSLEVVEPSAGYPLEHCVISGKPLLDRRTRKAINYKGTEVQFCCETCIPIFEAEPEKYMIQLREAGK